MPDNSPKSRDEFAVLVARAEELKPKLATETEKLNQVVNASEAFYVGLGLGVPARVNLWANEHEAEYLALAKYGSDWRLVVEYSCDAAPDDESVEPLVNSSRQNRITAIKRLPDLLAALIKAAEDQIRVVEASVESGMEFILNAVADLRDTADPTKLAKAAKVTAFINQGELKAEAEALSNAVDKVFVRAGVRK